MSEKRSKIRDVPKKEFYKLLRKTGCCTEAVSWAEGKTFLQAWRACRKFDWLQFFIWRMADSTFTDWPNIEDWDSAYKKSRHSAKKFKHHIWPALIRARGKRTIAAGQGQTK